MSTARIRRKSRELSLKLKSTRQQTVTFANIDVALILQTVIYYSIKQDFTRGSV